MFGNELKFSQFANNTNLVCAGLIYVEKALRLVPSIVVAVTKLGALAECEFFLNCCTVFELVGR